MKMVRVLVLTLVVIVNFIGCSSQSGEDPHRERDTDLPSSTREEYTPHRTSTERAPFRARSRSPASRSASIKLFGYPLEQLGYIRFISRKNESLQLELRNYVFAASTQINLRKNGKRYTPVPAREHIVLSASNGDIFAIVEYSGVLRGIYRRDKYHSRIKMNMISGAIDDMTPDNIRDCPVGENHPIFPNSFIISYGNYDSLHAEQYPNQEHSFPNSSSSARQHSPVRTSLQDLFPYERSVSPPGRPPSDQVLGYKMEQLGYLRLIPRTNQNLRFEFRRYVFPPNKPVRMRIKQTTYAFDATQEYIVLSTSNGDVFGILDYSGTLLGIYATDRYHSRVKINMMSGAVENLDFDEIKDCPIGKRYPIFPTSFMEAFGNHDSLQSEQITTSERNSSLSSVARKDSPVSTPSQVPLLHARPKSPPGRPPSDQVLGYTLAKLGYIRLIPRANRNRQFEFRRYVIPPSEPIRFHLGHIYLPVPKREHIVLSTSEGDVFAILEYTEILRGIYTTNNTHARIKLNMITRAVVKMTATEMSECPIGERFPIFPRWFKKIVVNEDSLQHVYH